MLELRHLLSFLTVAEEGHVGRAARRLGIEQSPLSRRLQALERELGVELFERTPRGLRLTPAGREFRAGVHPLLRQLEDSKHRAVAVARGESGRLAIGCVVASAYDGLLAETLRTFAIERPAVTVSISIMGSTEGFEALRDGRIDVALSHSPPPPAEGFQHRLLSDDPFAVALPADVVAARDNGPVRLGDLADMSWIMLPRSASAAFYDSFIEACEAVGFTPKIRYETTSTSAALSLVAAGLGAVFKSSRQAKFAPPGVTFRVSSDFGRSAETFVVWRPDPAPSPALSALIDAFGETAGRMVPRKGSPKSPDKAASSRPGEKSRGRKRGRIAFGRRR